jgi:hypothetical protein
VRRVELRLRGRVLAPEVDGRRRRVPLRLHGGDQSLVPDVGVGLVCGVCGWGSRELLVAGEMGSRWSLLCCQLRRGRGRAAWGPLDAGLGNRSVRCGKKCTVKSAFSPRGVA